MLWNWSPKGKAVKSARTLFFWGFLSNSSACLFWTSVQNQSTHCQLPSSAYCILAVFAHTVSHSAPGLAGGLCWWLWLPTCWNSQEWWRLGGELAGDRNSVRTAELAEPFREPQSGVTSPQSPALSAGEGDEIWTPFNIPPNNCVDKRHELPSAGMSWHLDN